VFKQAAYTVIGDRMYAVDLNTRNVIWSYPDDKQVNFPGRFVDSVMVQEHELKAEGLQIFIGTAEGKLITLEVDGNNKVSEYPRSTLGWAASAAPVSYSHDNIRGVVYIPAGQRIIAYDISSVTSEAPMEKIYEYKTVGDILCRPIPAMVTGSKAILVTDSTGNLNALSANPDNQRGVRTPLASWGLEPSARFSPAIDNENNIAVITFANGAVTAIDLNKSGQPLWRFPDQGRNLGSINGPAAIGSNGVYVADSTGNLICIDLQTGKQKWRVDLLSAANTGVLVHDGRIYVGTRAGSVLCCEEGSD
jgi:outer membrane protein assembly factor BamB